MIEALIAYLKSQSAITAITNTIRSIPAPVDISEYPLITYQVSTVQRGYALLGKYGEDSTRIILRCFGSKSPQSSSGSNPSYSTAKQLARAVIAACDGVQVPGQHMILEVLNESDDFDTNNLINICTVTLKVVTW